MRFVEYDPALKEIPLEDQSLEIPRPRSGHSMTLAGEPQDYILIYGGVSNETVTSQDGVQSVIKRTMDDLWVFYVRSSQWNRIYPNSKTNPSKREYSKMVTVRSDRAMFMFGGQYGERLYNDLWQWNVNTNMWAPVILEDARTLLKRGGPADIAAAKALNSSDFGLAAYQNCTQCDNCKMCGKSDAFSRMDCQYCELCQYDGETGKINCETCKTCWKENYFECI